MAGSLTATAGAASGTDDAGVFVAMDPPARPTTGAQASDPFEVISAGTAEIPVVTQVAASSAHEALVAAEIERQRQEAEQRAAREAEERARLATMYVAPVSSYTISSPFGGYRNHGGIDLAGPHGQPVRAVHSGTVVELGWDGSYGYKVQVRHEDGTETWYAHLSAITVGLGPVTTGAQLGLLGSTGRSTGPHLHLEVRSPDGSRMNPYPWLAQRGVSL